MGKRDARQMLVAVRRPCGQSAGGPMEVRDQSTSAIRAPISPPEANRWSTPPTVPRGCRSGRRDEPGDPLRALLLGAPALAGDAPGRLGHRVGAPAPAVEQAGGAQPASRVPRVEA